MIKVSGIEETLKTLNTSFKNEIFRQKRQVSERLIQKLKDKTPVDTGFARDSWHYTNNSLENDAEYIDDLNEGSSPQAERYFVETTLLQTPGVKPNGNIVSKK